MTDGPKRELPTARTTYRSGRSTLLVLLLLVTAFFATIAGLEAIEHHERGDVPVARVQ